MGKVPIMLTAIARRRVVLLASGLLAVAAAGTPFGAALPAAKAASATVLAVRAGEMAAEGGRLVVELSAPTRYKSFTLDAPARVVLDLPAARVRPGTQVPGAATHRPGRLPTLWTCETSLALLTDLIGQLINLDSMISAESLGRLYDKHRGNLRDVLRELYDRAATETDSEREVRERAGGR